jgi:hypothetical protein
MFVLFQSKCADGCLCEYWLKYYLSSLCAKFYVTVSSFNFAAFFGTISACVLC